MAAKKKLLEFDSDFDDGDGSMHSSELSELDSDVHSLSSLKWGGELQSARVP